MRTREEYQELLDSGRISEVIESVQSDPRLKGKDIDSLAQSYQLLTDYYARGAVDPYRYEMLEKITVQLTEVVNRIDDSQELPHQHGSLYSEKRQKSLSDSSSIEELLCELLPLDCPIDPAEIGNESEQEQQQRTCYYALLGRLFDKVWTTPRLTQSEREALRYFAREGAVPGVCTTVVALFWSLMQSYDHRKWSLLAELIHDDRERIAMTALPLLLWVNAYHHESLSREVSEEMKLLRSSLCKLSPAKLFAAYDAIYTSYKTDADHQTYQEKIMPEIMRMMQKFNLPQSGSDLLDKLKEGTSELEQYELEKKMRNMQDELPRDRDLVYHGVTELKRFAFFQELHHWFLPFDPHHPMLDAGYTRSFLSLLPFAFKDTMMPSSDLYSYCCISQWKQVREMMGDKAPDVAPTLPDKDLAYYAKDVVYGVYRFCRLSPWRDQFVDLFTLQPDVCAPEVSVSADEVQSCCLPPDFLRTMGRRLFYLQQYAPALTLLRALVQRIPPEGEDYRLLSVCAYRVGDLEHSRDYLLKAIEDEGEQYITVYKIAELSDKLGDPQEAIAWYEKAEKQENADYKASYQKGVLLEKMGELEKAREALFRAYFLCDGEYSAVVLALASVLVRQQQWAEVCERLRGEAAETALGKLLLGIALRQRDSHREALESLDQWYRLTAEQGHEMLWKQMKKYYPGISSQEIGLMLDTLRIRSRYED